ncbi:MAG: peptidoglycan DD-metalloendopeptidase family protein [Muribaculaceae bacterium]|nr:peptidoglycan DD-metalloendopeptidase family protein [Muribaculaceae bacterium]
MRFNHIVRLLIVVLIMALCGEALEAKQRRKAKSKPARTVENVRKEQNTTHRRISETAEKININDAELKRRMGQLNALNADIETQTVEVKRLRSNVDSIGSAIRLTSDSIALMERDLEGLRRSYADAMAKLQPSAGRLDMVTFLFSSKSFSEAWSRLRYLRRFAEWRQSKADDIESAIDRISTHRQQLTGLRHSHDLARRQAEQQQHLLEARQNESKKLVASLRKEDSRLKRELKEQQSRAAALDRELDRLIAEEQARIAREEKERKRREAAEAARRNKASKTKTQTPSAKTTGKSTSKSTAKSSAATPSSEAVASARATTQTAAATAPAALTGSFLSNKGKLLFPVSGSYKIVRRFGRQPHPTLKHVTVDNSGIDIETRRGTQARAIFAGTVSAIFQQPGYGTIVMLRHGTYLSVYAGLSSASVSKGQKVKAGQNLGAIAIDPLRDVATLHFEIRNERTKLNPTAWVK